MKLCIPSNEANGLESAIEAHFPSASYLIIFDTETRQHKFISVHEESDQDSTAIDAVLCTSINRMTLRNLLDQGIQVYGTEASVVQEAINQFERGELEAVGVASVCGSHGHDRGEGHECCGSHGNDDPDHECCGGKGHDDPDHECCGGKGHGHEHGGCGGQGQGRRGEGGCGCHG